jgi:hypothetical protein
MAAMSRTRTNTNCAVCRLPFPVAAVVKLFLEQEQSLPHPAPPLMDSQKEAGKVFIKACERVDEDAGEEEMLQIIVK